MSPSRLSDCGFSYFGFVSKMTMLFTEELEIEWLNCPRHTLQIYQSFVSFYWSFIKLLVPGTSVSPRQKHPSPPQLPSKPMTLAEKNGGNPFVWVSPLTVSRFLQQMAEKDDVLHRAGKSGGSYLYVSWFFGRCTWGNQRERLKTLRQRFIFKGKSHVY